MSKRFYRIISLVMTVLLTFSSADFSAFALTPEEVSAEREQLSAEMVSSDDIATAEEGAEASEGPLLRYLPIEGEGEYESSRAHLDDDMLLMAAMALLPEKYDLEDSRSYLPATRNQTPYGTCWAHSIMAAAEIDFIKNKGYERSLDLAELQLAYFMYNSPQNDPLGLTGGDSNKLPAGYGNFLTFGGNVECAKKIMQGWIGAGEDTGKVAFNQAKNILAGGLSDEYAFQDKVHLQNYYNISIRNPAERDEVKRAIQEYGAITASYYEVDRFYSRDQNSFYCNEPRAANHAVTIVGWDDNFSANDFRAKAPGNGAWLIRNSWVVDDSRTYGRDTYFWISYYDKSLTGGVVMLFEEADNYANNYHYDGSAGDEADVLPSGAQVANVFTAMSGADVEMLQAVSFETDSSNVEYIISIYKNLADTGDPESGEFWGSTEGMTFFSGYYTVPLDQAVPLTRGETFSVVITMSHRNGDKVSVSREVSTNFFGAQFTASSKSGESFYRYPEAEAHWVDWGAYGKGNYRIKAFTDPAESDKVPAVKLAFAEDKITLACGEVQNLNLSVTPSKAWDKRIVWSSSDPEVASVSKRAVTANGLGTATITATIMSSLDSEEKPVVSASCEVTVKTKLELPNETARYDGSDEKVDYNALILGRSFQPEVRCTPASGQYTLRWTSDNPDVVDISETGQAAVVGRGAASLTVSAAEDPEIRAAVPVDVKYLDCVVPKCSIAEDYSNVKIAWDSVIGAEKYVFAIGAQGGPLFPESPSEKCSCTVSDLIPGMKYVYTITAYGEDGIVSYASEKHYFDIPLKHTVTYWLFGGTNAPENPSEVYEGKEYALYPPTRAGYAFGGWYGDREYRTPAVSSIRGDNTADVTLYASWKLDYAAETPRASIENGAVVDAGTKLYLTSATGGTDIYYTIDGSDPLSSETRVLYEESVILDRDVSLRAVATSSIYRNSGVLEVSYRIRNEADDWGDVCEADRKEKGYAAPGDVPKAFWATGVHDAEYEGKAVTFAELRVYDHKTLLVKNRDYTVSYQRNAKVGTASVTITGKGNFSGKSVLKFQITDSGYDTRKKLSKAKLNGLPASYTWEAGTIFEPEVGDGTVTYRTDGGTNALKGILKAEYEALPDEMKKGYDYIYEYIGDTASAGTAKLVFTGVNEFSGSKTHSYAIKGRKFSNAKINGLKKSYTWTGEPVRAAEEDVFVTYKSDGITIDLKGIEKAEYYAKKVAGEPVLEYDYVYEYSGAHVDRGTVKIIFSGVNEYSGSVKKSFKIAPFSLDSSEISVADIGTVVYTKNGAKPGVRVTDSRTGAELVQGKDYTLSYLNNKTVGSSRKVPTVKIKGKGNYSGTIKKTFDISGSSLANVQIKATDIVYRSANNLCKPTITLTDSNGQKLRAGTDYVKAIRYQYVRDTKVKTVEKKKGKTVYAETVRSEGSEVMAEDIVPVGTEILARVKGKGNYDPGSVKLIIFRYVSGNLSKAEVSVSAQTYTGRPVEPGKEAITVSLNGVVLKKTDYEIVGYSRNVSKGTAQITIRGVGRYGGTKKAGFTIKRKSMNDF